MGNPIFSYTHRSLENSRQEGFTKIPIISRGDWTDLNATDPGMIILDYVHALVDMINFYQDHQALETFISTAKERKNIFRLAKQLCFQITSSKGATVDLEFYIEQYYSETIRIPKYTIVTTATDIPFITLEDAYITAGSLSVTVPAVQGEHKITSYVGTGISRYSNVSRAEDQYFTLGEQNIDIDSIEIIDSLDRYWNPVEYIVFSDTDELAYQKDLNHDGTITLKFGNGVRGAIPSTTDTLYISYIQSRAEEGRTGANTITFLKDRIYDVLGNSLDDTGVKVLVTNRESTAGGSGPLSDEEITLLAPGAIKAQDRAVTIKDFENLARTVNGVADAVAYDINNSPEGFCLYHEVKVVIMPEIGTSVNSSLINRVYEFLQKRMIPPTNLQVLGPANRVLDIDITVVRQTGAVEGGIEYSVIEAVKEYFNDRYGAIGESFNPNELIARVSSVQGVRYVERITPATPVSVTMTEIIRLGTVTVHVTE